jgi:BON domain
MKRTSLFVSSLVIAAILMLGMGCSKKLDDAQMTSQVQAKFSQDSGLASKQLSVQANDGVVTLSGTVDNTAQRDAAGSQAASIPGVKTVVNNLQIGDAAAAMSAQAQPSTAPTSQPDAASQASSAAPADKPEPGAGKKASRNRDRSARRSTHESNDQMAMNTPPPASTSAPSGQDNMAAATSTPPPPPPPPAPKKFIIDQGTQVTVRLIDPIDSEKNQTGDSFHATLNAPLTSDGEEAVPAGVELTGHLASVKSAGKFAGQSEVVMQLDSLTSGGRTYNLQTDQYKKTGSSRGKNTAEKVGGGAVIGSLIGALAGGGKGAAIGAAAGAGVGGGVQAATKSQQIKFPSETVLNFTLQAPVTVVQAQGSDASRQKLTNSQ